MANVLRAWTAVSVVALGAGAVQCSLLPSLDGLVGGQGLPDASDEVPRDVSPADAPAESGDGGRWCASLSPTPMFCDDFDDQGPFTRWTDLYVRSGGTVGRDGTAFRSAPNALLALSPASVDPSSSLVYLSTTATKSKVRIAYDMRIDARDPKTGYAEINYINFDTPGLAFAVYLRVFDSASSVTRITSEVYLPDGGIPAHDVALAGMPRFDVWTRVGVEVDVASTPRTLTVTIDGIVAALQTLEPGLYAPGPVSARVGIGYTGYPTTGDWRIRYDNVTIDWE